MIRVPRLVAAGMLLRGNQHQARADGFRLRGAAEHRNDAEDQSIRGENAEADGREYRCAKNEGHNQRIHDRKPFYLQSLLNCQLRALLRRWPLVLDR